MSPKRYHLTYRQCRGARANKDGEALRIANYRAAKAAALLRKDVGGIREGRQQHEPSSLPRDVPHSVPMTSHSVVSPAPASPTEPVEPPMSPVNPDLRAVSSTQPVAAAPGASRENKQAPGRKERHWPLLENQKYASPKKRIFTQVWPHGCGGGVSFDIRGNFAASPSDSKRTLQAKKQLCHDVHAEVDKVFHSGGLPVLPVLEKKKEKKKRKLTPLEGLQIQAHADISSTQGMNPCHVH